MRINFEQKEIKYASGKKILLWILTAINSGVVTTTYFQSGNDFLWHNGVVEDHQLTQSNERWEWYLLGVNSLMCGFVLVSNQFGMASHISKFLRKVCGMSMPKNNQRKISRPVLAIIGFGALCKAVISSSSLLSSVRDIAREWPKSSSCSGFSLFGKTGDWQVSSICSGFSLFGNFGATAVVLLEHTSWRGNQRPSVAKFLAGFVGVLYGISQGCLYSNALFNPLLLTGLLKERPGICSDLTGQLIFAATAWPLTEFAICSGQVMYQKTCKVLGRADAEEKRTRLSKCQQSYQKVRGGVASGYRILALLAAVFCFFYFPSGNNLMVTCIITAFCSLAAPGVIAVLYPLSRSTRGSDFFASASHRLLPINEPDDDSDDEQYPVPYLP